MDIELSPKAAEIVACARSLLASNGYHGFSYADVSAAVGISKPTIHHHFATKAELVHTVVKLYRSETRTALAALDRQLADPVARVRAYAGYWEACIRDGTATFCVCAMLAAESTAIPKEVATEVRGHFRDLSAWLGKVLAAGAKQKSFRLDGSADAEAMSFMASVHGGMLSARALGSPATFATIVNGAIDRLQRAR